MEETKSDQEFESSLLEGDFLSPEESEPLLASLDAHDSRTIGGNRAGESALEGIFIPPGEEGPGTGPAMDQPESKSPPYRQESSSNLDMLSRIAGELRSIKAELGSLKTTYDTMHGDEAGNARTTAAPADTQVVEPSVQDSSISVPIDTFEDIKKLLTYLDRLLESLPEEKIDGFAQSEYFDLYRKVFEFFNLA